MIIGIPKEIKNNENRVAITPAGVKMLSNKGHDVLIQSGAGKGSGFSDGDYNKNGADIYEKPKDVFENADMILKVKEPLQEEYDYLKPDSILFTYLHLAACKELAKVLLDKNITGIAYETVMYDDGLLPLLLPMSQVAGRMSVQIGASILQKYNGGSGVLLGGVPGVEPGKVVIIGGGTVGSNATKIAVGLGANVTVMDINPVTLMEMDNMYNGRINTVISNEYEIADKVKDADLLIGAVLIPGAKAPKIVTEDMVKTMKKGSVIVDVAIDQGGSVETIDRVTTHDDPTYEKYGVIHYSVANMPGAVPLTSTLALTAATMPYVMQLAAEGVNALNQNEVLKRGLNTYKGEITNKAVSKALKL